MQSLGQLKIKIYYWGEYDIEGGRRMKIAAEFFIGKSACLYFSYLSD